LRGSHTVKLPNKWWENPDAFPRRFLYVDLRKSGTDPTDSGSEDERGETEGFVFLFRTPEQATAENDGGRKWMRVSDALAMRQTKDVLAYAQQAGVGNDADATTILSRLHEIVHVHGTISPFIGPDQSIDR
jgi:hypothetical protein